MTAKETLSVEEQEILHALDEVEQTIDAMSSVLADLRAQLADHLERRREDAGPSVVLEFMDDPLEPNLH